MLFFCIILLGMIMTLTSIYNQITSEDSKQFAFQTVGAASLAAVCGYGGTFFFTALNPVSAATYFAVVALTSHVAYQALEKLKESVEAPRLKQVITAVQLLQFSILFYFFHGLSGAATGAAKLEMITATAYFVAIPVFFHLAIEAWKDPTLANIGVAVGVMLPLVSGLGGYAKAWK